MIVNIGTGKAVVYEVNGTILENVRGFGNLLVGLADLLLIAYHEIIELEVVKYEACRMDTLQKRQNLDSERVHAGFWNHVVHGLEILLKIDSQSRHYHVGSQLFRLFRVLLFITESLLLLVVLVK